MKRLIGFGLMLVALVASRSAIGDTVLLANGDRISGQIVHKNKDRLDIRTRYAGTVSVRWSHVVAVTSERQLTIQRRSDDRLVRGTLIAADEDSIAVDTGQEGVVTVPLQDVGFVNPTLAESGRGIVYKGRASLAASANSGNSDTRRLYGETSLSGTARVYRFNLGASGEAQQEGGETNAFKWRLGADYDQFTRRDRRRFVYARASLEHDRFADIRLRSITGAGYGWQIVETAVTSLSLRGGVDLVFLDRIDDDDERYPAAGWGLRYSRSLLSDTARFFHEQEGFVEVGAPSNISVLTKTGLRFPVVDNLNASAQYNLDYEGEPGDGRKSLDASLVVGLGYDW
ncbi:MAG: DUF481 domain-containing protein [Rhodocyclaceae bacterium]|nr:DUF481 domain-containing protein [Rhodocyclaceae bacterium]